MKISAFNSSPATEDEVELIAALRIAAAVDIAAMNVRGKKHLLDTAITLNDLYETTHHQCRARNLLLRRVSNGAQLINSHANLPYPSTSPLSTVGLVHVYVRACSRSPSGRTEWPAIALPHT